MNVADVMRIFRQNAEDVCDLWLDSPHKQRIVNSNTIEHSKVSRNIYKFISNVIISMSECLYMQICIVCQIVLQRLLFYIIHSYTHTLHI